MQLKGRHHLMLWLLLFLVVAAGIVARQNSAIATARRRAELRTDRTNLEAQRADLEGRIREASSRRALAPLAASLGLHEPSDSEVSLVRVTEGNRR